MPASEAITIGEGAQARPRFPLRLWLGALTKSSTVGLKSAHFRRPWVAAGLIAPQLLILLFFFFIPTWKALSLGIVQVEPFGRTIIFVGVGNVTTRFNNPRKRDSAILTLWFTVLQCVATLVIACLLAFATDHVVRGKGIYKGVILLPYAIAPAISGVLWAFLFNPTVGPLAHMMHDMGLAWDPNRRPFDAILLVSVAAIWKHICYDYIFLTAAFLAVPNSIIEAAAIDGARPIRRFFSVTLPMATPTIFFLIVMNFVYGLFETFGIIDTITHGGPAGSTNTLVYKVYQDGFRQLDLGSSAAQSVVLMAIAVVFTIMQFRALERKVNYQV